MLSSQIKGSYVSYEEAILLLQRHERARQGRLRAKLMREIRKQEQQEKTKAAEPSTDKMAAEKIQSMWKGAMTRKEVRKMREKELAFVGMASCNYN